MVRVLNLIWIPFRVIMDWLVALPRLVYEGLFERRVELDSWRVEAELGERVSPQELRRQKQGGKP